jgi:hypothetical protein
MSLACAAGLRSSSGVADRDPRGKAVPLSLGQRIGALHLDRVLRRDHHERQLQRVGRAIHGDLPFFHALQHGRLGLRGGPVDLVAQHHVGEDRPGLELELADLLVVGAHPGDVAGQQVRSELHAANRAVDGPGERLGQQRLADTRHVLDQDVSLGQQDREGQPDGRRLADDDGFH